MRVDGRKKNQLRALKITTGYTKYAEGSVLIEMGDTKVICTASVEEGVPPFLRGKGQGWVTAEYSMLPRATMTRNTRDIAKLKLNGRTSEIQRLIGRSLRSVTDLSALGERTVTVDCDVIQADGGTRTASITGGFVALALAFQKLVKEGTLKVMPLSRYLAAVSVGLVDGEALLDLCYREDSAADVDMNVVMDSSGNFSELQATGEEATFTKKQFDELTKLAESGIKELMKAQKKSIGDLNKDYPHYKPLSKVVIATNNAGKLKEMREMLTPLGIELLSMAEAGVSVDAEETGGTFEENALIKAKAVMEQSGMAAVADDSGLSVDFLDGAPGVYSARYAGEGASDDDRNRLLLKNMENCPKGKRTAYFTSALALCIPDGRSAVVTGKCFGTILDEPRGEKGFGYDPLFLPDGFEKTFGELPEEIKNTISHRANAMKRFLEKCKEYI